MAARTKPVKAITPVVSIELPRVPKAGGPRFADYLGGNDVSDVKRGIEVALKGSLDRTFGDVCGGRAYRAAVPLAPATRWKKRSARRLAVLACGVIVGAPAPSATDGRYRPEVSQR